MHEVFSTPGTRFFGSDNAATVHPEVMEALAAANRGHIASYGGDVYTRAAEDAFDKLFQRKVNTFFVYNGTGANGVSLATLLRPYQSVLCAETAHIFYDECGAPEHLTGSKLQPVPSQDGKVQPEQLMPFFAYHGNMHHAQPAVLSISQATEFGTLYTLDELRALSDLAHAHHMLVHMDGARICNAAAALNCSMADMTWRAGIDVVSFGGTKNGLMFGEAVLLFDDTLAADFPFVRKNCAQLASKMRFIAAQYIALLDGDLWLRNATHANAMTTKLARGLSQLPGVRLTHKAEANEIFMALPPDAIEPLRSHTFFYTWDAAQHIVRLVTSWDTQEEEVDAFLHACRTQLGKRG